MRHSESLVLVLILPSTVVSVFGQLRNVTVDDSDSSIVYSPAGAWSVSNTSNPLDYGGFHHLSDLPTAQAEFVFTGTLPRG